MNSRSVAVKPEANPKHNVDFKLMQETEFMSIDAYRWPMIKPGAPFERGTSKSAPQAPL